MKLPCPWLDLRQRRFSPALSTSVRCCFDSFCLFAHQVGVLHSVRNNPSEMWMLQLKQNPAHRSLYRQHTQQPGRSPLFTCTALKLLVLHIQGRLVPKAFPAPTIWYLYLMQKPFLASNKFLLLCRCSSAEPWWESVQR